MDMAEARSRLALSEVRASVKRMQTEGEKLVARIRRDAKTFATRSRQENIDGLLKDARRVQTDVRKRVESALKELDEQRTRIVASLEEQVTKLIETVVGRLNLAKQDDVAELRSRIAELERRVDALGKSKEKAA
jgi:polyhydroxyalkanoate synthesis regulator phasin